MLELQELQEYSTIKNWLGRLGLSSRRVHLSSFYQFMKWVRVSGGNFKDYTPDQLLEYQRQADNGTRYDLLDLAQRYILQSSGTVNTKNNRYTGIRSFFIHNRAPLPADKFNIKGGNGVKPPVQGILEVEEVKLTILSCNKMFQACFLSMFQSAMDQEMLTYWNLNGYSDLLEQLKHDPKAIKINLPGRKRSRNERPFYTFIGSDAIKAIRNYLEIRPEFEWTTENRKRTIDKTKPVTAIFVNQYGKPISKQALGQYWIRHLRKVGLVGSTKERTGKSLHEMRDVWRSLWSKSPADHMVAEYLMGHSIDPLNYDKSFRDVEFYKKEYLKALPFLQILSEGAAFGQVQASEVEELLHKKTLEQNGRIKELEDMVAQLKQEDKVRVLENRVELMQKGQEEMMKTLKTLYKLLPREEEDTLVSDEE